MIPSLERRVWPIDNSVAGNLAAPVEALLYASLAPARLSAVLLAVFAVTALALGLIGVYGVLSYSVRHATREIGVRLALGASQAQVMKLVLGEALGLTAAGVAAGILCCTTSAIYEIHRMECARIRAMDLRRRHVGCYVQAAASICSGAKSGANRSSGFAARIDRVSLIR